MGRNLYPEVDTNGYVPGPGSYENSPERSKSFGYIHKKGEIPNRLNKIKKQASLNKLGPGYYNTENIFDNLSQHKKGNELKFSPNLLK